MTMQTRMVKKITIAQFMAIDSMSIMEFCNNAMIKLLTPEWLAGCLGKFNRKTIEHLL